MLATYLSTVSTILASGAAVPETSYYPALISLFNAVGDGLTPPVTAILHPRNLGAGIPDIGFFTQDQLRGGDPLPGQKPARGVVEVKAATVELDDLATDPQVARYLAAYGLVLITNLRAFQIVGRTPDGAPLPLERFTLAESVPALRALAQHRPDPALSAAFTAFVQRALQTAAPLTSPADVATMLAAYAREARARLEGQNLPALATLRTALEEALGIRFEGPRGENFFRSTLVQTLFYGIFSAWVLWQGQPRAPGDRFDWRLSGWLLNVPLLSSLFNQVAQPHALRALRLEEVLDWTGVALARVERAAFFSRWEERLAVPYFYEPFLEAFDPDLRRQLGVWYTPPEIVQYMVSRVDAALRTGLGLRDGLADERVVVLDPATGTGAFLVEVARRIVATHTANGDGPLAGEFVRRALQTRIVGFELLPAPYVIAHLQIGLFLQSLQTPIGEGRAAVYLTNALTGWDATTAQRPPLPLPELSAERDAAEAVKQRGQILVVLGNPPYNGFAGLAVAEERDLSNAYRTTQAAPRPQGQGLNDLYVRFFRMAERQIVERTGQGIVCFISNYSWLDGLSFPGMRERYLQAFDQIWIDNLHGDRIISEYAPDGRTSETVFAMRGQSVGIKVGTAIALMVRRTGQHDGATVHYRDHDAARAEERRAGLLASLNAPDFAAHYQTVTPVPEIGLPFKPLRVAADYLAWPLLPDLFPVSFPGVKTSRDEALVAVDRTTLEQRMVAYFDPTLSDAQVAAINPRIMESVTGYNAEAVRKTLLARVMNTGKIVPYIYRPFDLRWLYWEEKLLDRARPDFLMQVFEGNVFIEARQHQAKADFDRGYVTTVLADNFGSGLSSFFPLYLKPTNPIELALNGPTPRPNLSQQAQAYLDTIGGTPADLFYHAVAILHSPAYRAANAGALRQDWPRLPLPATLAALRASAELGRTVSRLLDPTIPVRDIVPDGRLSRFGFDGGPRPLPTIGTYSYTLDAGSPDWTISAGWGYRGRGGIIMPGQGRVTVDERGGDLRIHLNATTAFGGVPPAVWEYTLGGYQVLKKWLSYREADLLGRALTPDEARTFRQLIQRIALLIDRGDDLDANYQA